MPEMNQPERPAEQQNKIPKKLSPWSEEAKRFDKGVYEGGRSPLRLGGSLLAIVVIAIVIGAGGYFFYTVNKPQGPKVGLQFSKPDQILLGDQFIFSVSYTNYSDQILKNAKLSLFLPDGVSFLGQSEGQRVMEQAVGDVGPGSIQQKDFSLIVTSGGESLKHISSKIGYQTTQSSNPFESSSEVDLLVGQAAVSLNLTVPQNVLNGGDFDVKADYVNNTGHEFKNLRIKLDFPPFFQFKNSSMQPEANSKNSWFLGTVPAAGNGSILTTGSVVGPENSFFSVNGTITAEFLGQTYTINSQAINVSISSAPLSVSISANDNPDYVANIGDNLTYTINYVNNSSIVMQNAQISAKLISDLFDFANLPAQTPFNSLTNTITWFTANTPQLASIPPGQGGSINFNIKLKDAFPIRLLSDKNYTLRVDATIQSPTVPPNTAADKTISVTSITNKVAGKIDVAAEAYWRDAASGILNKGPYPPRVNQPTQYTVHWRLRNYATDVTSVKVTGYLQSGVRFTGVVKSNMNTSPTYDANSGLITWLVPAIPATKGAIGVAPEAIFQIEATPAVNQTNQVMPLVSITKAEAADSFVGTTLQAQANALDTGLPFDKTVAGVPNKSVTQ